MIGFAEKNDINAISALDKHISESEVKSCIERRRVIVYRTENGLAGWLRYGLFWDNIPFMNMLFVVEGERGRGIGSALCDFWEKEIKQQGFSLALTSTLSDEQGQFFYRKRGYKDCGSLILPGEPLEIIFFKKL